MAGPTETIRRIRVQTLSEGGDAARRDMMATADAHAKLGQAAGAAAVVVDLASRKQLSANAAFDRAVRSVDAVAAATYKYENTVRQLNRGLEQGEKTQEEYNSALELAQLRFTAAVDKAEKFQAALRGVATETQKLNVAQMEDPGKRLAVNAVVDNPRFSTARNRGDDIKAYAAELDKLQAEFDPIASATQKYNAYLDRLDMAHRVGAISIDVMNARLAEAVTAHDALIDKLNGVVVAQEKVITVDQRAGDAAAKLRVVQMVSSQTVAARDRGADIEAFAEELDRRRAKYDEVFAAGQRYRAGLAELRNDLAVGAITEDLYTATLEKRKAAFAAQINDLGNYSRAQREAAAAAKEAAAAEAAAADKRNVVQMMSRQQTPARDRGADIAAYGDELDRMRESLVPLAKAERDLADSLEMANRAFRVGAIDAKENREAIDAANYRYRQQVTEINKATESQKKLANGAGLTGYAYQNLSYQVNDVVTSLASGIPVTQVISQQFGQIYQILQSGEGGVSGALKGIAQTSVNAVRSIGLVGGAFGLLAGTAITAGIAAYSFSKSIDALDKQIFGIGQASGTTAGQIAAMAAESSAAAGLSNREFRSLAGTFAATGEIGSEMYDRLSKATKDYASRSGVDLATAGSMAAAAFAEPGKGAEDLNKKYAILNGSQVELIKRLDAQGDRLGAQKMLLDAYARGVANTKDETASWGRVMEDVGNRISNAWDRVGATVSKALGGGSLEARLSDARNRLERSQGTIASYLPGQSAVVARNQAEVKSLEELIQKRNAEAEQRRNNRDSTEAQGILDRRNPALKQIEALEDEAKKLDSLMGSMTIDKQGDARRAIAGMAAQAKQMREDLIAGGAGLADALRTSQFNNRMVGAVGYGADRAGIIKKYDDERTEAFRKAGDNTNTDELNKTLQNINERMELDLNTLEKTTTQAAVKIGGAFSRMSKEVQEQALKGAARFPAVPAGLIAALAKNESRGNINQGFTDQIDENGKPGTAYGLGQIVKTTGDEIKRKYGIDRMNKDTAGEAIAAVVQTKLDAVDGNLDQAIMNYRGSRNPAINRAYLAKVKKDMGEMGDISVGAQANAQDAATKATRDQREELERVSALYGVSTEKLETQAQAQARYNQLVDAGMEPNEEFRKSLMGIAAAAVAATRDTTLAKFQSDQVFARDQLGRADTAQQAYSSARSTFGDVNDPRAKVAIADMGRTQDLTESKALIKDSATSFVTELRRTGDAAAALSNVFGSIADKMISKLLDTAISGAFGASAVGGASGAGILGGLGKLFGFATGGIMTSRGPVPLNAYAGGGIARSPQMALFGEGRMPEAYVPLPDGKRIPVAMSTPANSNNGGGRTFTDGRTFNIDLRGSTLTQAEVQSSIAQALAQYDQNLNASFGEKQVDWRESA